MSQKTLLVELLTEELPPKALPKCDSGSDTPKNISPMPMPAANSIENQPR